MAPEALLQRISQLSAMEHRVLYYGPLAMNEVSSTVASLHKVPENLSPVPENDVFKLQTVNENVVYIAPSDANQIYMIT